MSRKDARFCATCGSQLLASVDTAKYKQVTVLFAERFVAKTRDE